MLPSALLAVLGLLFALTLPTPPAAGFGTINRLGQHAEHERITRAALACSAGQKPSSNGECFEPHSLDQLAGKTGTFGAVGAPDLNEILVAAAHCDDADFLQQSTGVYSSTGARAKATEQLLKCVSHLRARFRQGVVAAAGLLDQDRIVGREVNLQPSCTFSPSMSGRAKCNALEGLGRALHGAQDFYSHSNWADEADPKQAIEPANPPGLNRSGPSPILDLRGTGTPEVPPALSTGCFTLPDKVDGRGSCKSHITHAALNKDEGLIDPSTGKTKDPTTPRGKVKANFAKAVRGAISETRRQWEDMRKAIRVQYGDDRGWIMICALTHDDPVEDCDHDLYPSKIIGFLDIKAAPLTEDEKSTGVWFRTFGTASFEAHKRGRCRYHSGGCAYAIDDAKAKIRYNDNWGCMQRPAPLPFEIPGDGKWLENKLPNLTIDFRSVGGGIYRNITFGFEGKFNLRKNDDCVTLKRTTELAGFGPQPGPQWTRGQMGMSIILTAQGVYGTATLSFIY